MMFRLIRYVFLFLTFAVIGLNRNSMKVVFTFVISMFVYTNVKAQPTKFITNKDSYSWMFGLSWVLTDDDGDAYNPFSVQNLHTHLFPSKITLDKYIYNGFSTEALIAYSKYNPEKITNTQLGISGSLFSIDFHGKYSFYKLLNSGILDPYIVTGLGVSVRNNEDTKAQALSPTLNLGLGLNFWITQNIGIQLNSTAKIGMIDFFESSDYMQHSVGIVGRFESLKGSDNSFSKSKYKISKRRKKIKTYKKKKKKKRDDS